MRYVENSFFSKEPFRIQKIYTIPSFFCHSTHRVGFALNDSSGDRMSRVLIVLIKVSKISL